MLQTYVEAKIDTVQKTFATACNNLLREKLQHSPGDKFDATSGPMTSILAITGLMWLYQVSQKPTLNASTTCEQYASKELTAGYQLLIQLFSIQYV